MTTNELVTSVLAHQFSDTRYRDLIIKWLDEAQKFVLRQTDLRSQVASASFDTVVGTSTYSLPMDFRSLTGVYNDVENYSLKAISFEEFETMEDANGQPMYYVVMGNNLTMYPTPTIAQAYKTRYYSLPAQITALVSPTIPEDYHDILEHYAIWRCYLAEHDYEAASQHQGIYLGMIEKMKGEVQYDLHTENTQVAGAWSGDDF